MKWFALLGDEYKQYGQLLEGTTGAQLFEATEKGNLKDFIVNEGHCKRLEAEIRSPNTDLIRQARGEPPAPPKGDDNFRVYKARLTVILASRNQTNLLRTLDALLGKFPGKESAVYAQMCKKFGVEPLGPPTAEEIAALNKPSAPVKKGDFDIGEDCYAKAIGTDRWLNARVTHVNDDNTYDIFVYSAKAHGVAQEAVNVQREFLKKKSEQVNLAQPLDTLPAKDKRPKFQTGDRVKAFGLRSHTTYNGLCGVVLLYVPSERRYQVRLDTNDVIAIKERNVMGE